MQEPHSICLLNDSFPPTIDGVANVVTNYARILHDDGYPVMVATPEYPGVTDDYPYPVLRYASVNTTRLVGYRAGYPFSARAVSAIDDFHPDILHTHCPVASTLLARTAREGTGAPVVFTYHTKFDIDIRTALKGELLQNQLITAMVRNIEACDEVWTVSRGAGENLRSLGFRGEYRVMENGVDFPRGRATEAEIAAITQRHHLPQDRPVFLFIGRMRWYKGIRLILDGLAQARAQGARFTMLFVGDGGYPGACPRKRPVGGLCFRRRGARPRAAARLLQPGRSVPVSLHLRHQRHCGARGGRLRPARPAGARQLRGRGH